MIKELFVALGCPTIQANSEAETCCSNLMTLGLVDAIESGDSDVFACGASGLLLKSVGGDGSGAWFLEVLDMDCVSSALGLCQHGWIAVAALSGCDFLPTGVPGIGVDKAVQCTRAMLKHCGGEAHLRRYFVSLLEDGLPEGMRTYASLSGCKTSTWAGLTGARCYCIMIITTC